MQLRQSDMNHDRGLSESILIATVHHAISVHVARSDRGCSSELFLTVFAARFCAEFVFKRLKTTNCIQLGYKLHVHQIKNESLFGECSIHAWASQNGSWTHSHNYEHGMHFGRVQAAPSHALCSEAGNAPKKTP
jgi:hypothetical protein